MKLIKLLFNFHVYSHQGKVYFFCIHFTLICTFLIKELSLRNTVLYNVQTRRHKIAPLKDAKCIILITYYEN